MRLYIDYAEDDQVLYETRSSVEDAEGFLARLLWDDDVTEIHVTKGAVASPRWLEVEE
jgi:hypothetical protein